jgi:hypothetical protein
LEDFPAFAGFEEAATTFFFIFLAAEALALMGFVAFGMALCSPRSYELDPCSACESCTAHPRGKRLRDVAPENELHLGVKAR